MFDKKAPGEVGGLVVERPGYRLWLWMKRASCERPPKPGVRAHIVDHDVAGRIAVGEQGGEICKNAFQIARLLRLGVGAVGDLDVEMKGAATAVCQGDTADLPMSRIDKLDADGRDLGLFAEQGGGVFEQHGAGFFGERVRRRCGEAQVQVGHWVVSDVPAPAGRAVVIMP